MKRAFSSAATTVTTRRKQWVEKISARVFCPEESGIGGNPVTVFVPLENDDLYMSKSTQKKLAQSCAWESVMVSNSSSYSSHNSTLSFFMPTGQEVSFCAHAAMAGAIRVATDLDDETMLRCNLLNDNDDNTTTTSAATATTRMSTSAIVHEDDIVTLCMKNATYTQRPVLNPSALYRILRASCNLNLLDLQIPDSETPTFVHASALFNGGRPKTLVYVKDIQTLNEICKAPSPSDAQRFQRSLEYLNDGGADDDITTSGLYLYTKHHELDGAYVCRQFPIASGYPEDAATGIAAAALAGALFNSNKELPFIKFFQGEAMGRPSLILVEEKEKNEKAAAADEAKEQDEDHGPKPDEGFLAPPESRTGICSYKLMGKIEIDEVEEIAIEEDD